ncbi:MAG: CotH kinase family protein [Clostridia bacterium]|nr:CotH kinase family protein [Clostridia bacterium]
MKKRLLGFISLLAAAIICLSSCTATDSITPAVQSTTESQTHPAYETGLFDTSYVHKINVTIKEEDWNDLLQNPLNKTKYAVDVTIDGDTLENVSFATKGNTSLSQVASTTSNRYSFKINFGKYVEGQTYQGLDKLNLNNMMSDATYMKDYLSYLIMRKAGVNASLASYAELSINGQVHGLYIAIEDVSTSFLTRNYGEEDGALYKPEPQTIANIANGKQPTNGPKADNNEIDDAVPFSPDENSTSDQGPSSSFPFGNFQPPEGDSGKQRPNSPGQSGGQTPFGNFPGQPPEGFSGEMPEGFSGEVPEGFDGEIPEGFDGKMPGASFGEGGGADLVYTDDEKDSYKAIFENEENDVTEEDEQELIAAIKALSDGSAAQYWDMDQLIRYFAAHNFVLNYDGYTGTMLHNYYLYESAGKVTVFPWDYNLAFGGFMGGEDATASVNWGIDSPLSGTTEEARPLWNVIASNEEYLAAYHAVYDQLLADFFENGDCEAEIKRVYEMIRPYIEADPTAFYTLAQVDTAVDTLSVFCARRAESIRKQLSGQLSTNSDAQNETDRVDASDITIRDMGSQGGKGDAAPTMPGSTGNGVVAA